MSCKLLVVVILLTAQQATAQDSLRLSEQEYVYAGEPRVGFLGNRPFRESNVQLWPTVAMASVYTGLVVGLHINQNNAWWKDDSGDWHVVEDIEYARGLDKLGHIYSGYFTSTVCNDLLVECGFDAESSTLIGAGMGLAYMTYVEIEDGFATNWGFSPSDAASNVVGVGLFVLQHYAPFFQNFTPRWSYVPAEWTGERTINERPKTFIDDYNSTTFWLACNVNNLLPKSAEPYWPDWLMFSVGYGIRNYAVTNPDGTPVGVTRRFLFGLDYNWSKIIPETNIGFVNYLRQVLNYIRIPGPTIEVGDDGFHFAFFYPLAMVVPL
jgi:hypothetical protein